MGAMWIEKLEIIQGDITRQDVDAIVNAANTTLLGGGGVDGAIHRAAGPELLEECKKLGGCVKGEAKITAGYRLRATWVIHTVGPRWKGGRDGEDAVLRQCYRSCLSLAEKCFVRSIAFPSISTGAYGFPIDRAAHIALHEIKVFLERREEAADSPVSLQRVLIVCYDQATFDTYQTALDEMND